MQKKVLKNMIWNAIGTAFFFGCQWLLTVLVVHFDGGYQDAGVLSLAISVSTPLVMIANMNLRTFQVSELEGQFSDGDFLVNRVLMSGLAIALSFCVVAINGYNRYISICIVTYTVFRVTEALADVLYGIDQKAWRLDIAGKSSLMRGGAILLAAVCGFAFGKNLLLTIALMGPSAYLIIYFYDYRACRKSSALDLSYSPKRVTKLLKIGIPLVAYALLLTMISIYPRFEIERQYGEELLGYYSSVSTITVLVTQMASFIFSPFMGLFAEYRKEHNRSKFYRLLFLSFGGTAVIGVLGIAAGGLFGEWALRLLFGESIRPYAYLLVPIIITAAITAVIWLLCGLLTVFKDFVMLAVLTLISLVICVASSKILITERELIGAVVAVGISLTLEAILLSIRFVILLKKEKLLSGGTK